MNRKQQERHLEHIFSKMREIMLKKGNDYATQDRLSNFKAAGEICGISPELQCLSLISTKVARLSVLLHKKKNPNYESISDSVIDLINYAALLDMLLADKEENREQKGFAKYVEKTLQSIWSKPTSTAEPSEPKEIVCNECHGIGTIAIEIAPMCFKQGPCGKCKSTGHIKL